MRDLFAPRRLLWLGSFLAALAAHGALVLPWLWRDADALAGAGGQQLDVISVVMVSPGVLESRENDRIKPAAPAAAAPVEINEGIAAPRQNEIKQEEPEKPEEKPEETQLPADAVLETRPESSQTSRGAAQRVQKAARRHVATPPRRPRQALPSRQAQARCESMPASSPRRCARPGPGAQARMAR